MGEKASLSVQQVADAGLQITGKTPSFATRQIARMKSVAMEAPEKRANIVQTLEAYAAKGGRARAAAAADRAVATIMAVDLLEILQGD